MSDEEQDTADNTGRAIFSIGFVTGSISRPDVKERLVEGLKSGSLSHEYIRYCRDSLTMLLVLSGKEKLPGDNS